MTVRMLCLRVVRCVPVDGHAEACANVPRELWMSVERPPSFVSKLDWVGNELRKVARLEVVLC